MRLTDVCRPEHFCKILEAKNKRIEELEQRLEAVKRELKGGFSREEHDFIAHTIIESKGLCSICLAYHGRKSKCKGDKVAVCGEFQLKKEVETNAMPDLYDLCAKCGRDMDGDETKVTIVEKDKTISDYCCYCCVDYLNKNLKGAAND